MITTPEKKIKVQLLPKVSKYSVGSMIYVPGDVFEIPERLFKAYLMKKVSPQKKVTEKAPSPILEEVVVKLPKKETAPPKKPGDKSIANEVREKVKGPK